MSVKQSSLSKLSACDSVTASREVKSILRWGGQTDEESEMKSDTERTSSEGSDEQSVENKEEAEMKKEIEDLKRFASLCLKKNLSAITKLANQQTDVVMSQHEKMVEAIKCLSSKRKHTSVVDDVFKKRKIDQHEQTNSCNPADYVITDFTPTLPPKSEGDQTAIRAVLNYIHKRLLKGDNTSMEEGNI